MPCLRGVTSVQLQDSGGEAEPVRSHMVWALTSLPARLWLGTVPWVDRGQPRVPIALSSEPSPGQSLGTQGQEGPAGWTGFTHGSVTTGLKLVPSTRAAILLKVTPLSETLPTAGIFPCIEQPLDIPPGSLFPLGSHTSPYCIILGWISPFTASWVTPTRIPVPLLPVCCLLVPLATFMALSQGPSNL